jgi:hypothetical protein
MRLVTLVCCETCVIDQFTNRVSVFNIFEEILTPTLPIAIYSLATFSLWAREPGEPDPEATLTIKLNDRQMMQAPIAIAFQDKPRCRNVFTVNGLILGEQGQLTVEVAIGDAIYGTWTAPVLIITPAAEAVPAAPARPETE